MADAPQTADVARTIKSGDTVDVTVAGQYPLSGSVGYVLTEEKTVQVVINSPRGRWSLLLPDTWVVPRNGHWHVQIP